MRKIWPYVAGLGTAFILILVLEAALHLIFPMPSSASLNDPAAIDRAMRAMPVSAFAALLVAASLPPVSPPPAHGLLRKNALLDAWVPETATRRARFTFWLGVTPMNVHPPRAAPKESALAMERYCIEVIDGWHAGERSSTPTGVPSTASSMQPGVVIPCATWRAL